jgi:alpha-beta hydrolase superfamily lysophospholipase
LASEEDHVVIENPRIPLTSIHRVEADGVNVFYRQSGPAKAPIVLLLHGFPTSSFQYRELIPRLADRYRVIAPDLPGFGFTVVPEERQYKYTFDSLAKTVLAFTDALNLGDAWRPIQRCWREPTLDHRNAIRAGTEPRRTAP